MRRLVLSVVLLAACGSPPPGDAPDSGAPDADVATDAGPIAASLRLEPAHAVLVAGDPARSSQAFRAIVHFTDGSEADVTAAMAVTPALGWFDGGGVFTANGELAGAGTITASYALEAGGALTAAASIEVTIERTFIDPSAPPDIVERFATGRPYIDLTRRADVTYPLAGAVMPQNVFPADVQWRLASGALDRVTITKPGVTLVAYSAASHWLPDLPSWRALAYSSPEDDVVIRVDRLDGRNLLTGPELRFHFARTALAGAVYYWDVSRTRIFRIDDGAGVSVDFMPTPPGDSCIGCHSVSRSGRYMAGALSVGGFVGGVFDLTLDLSGRPPPTVFAPRSGSEWYSSSFAPDDARIAAGTARGIEIFDTATGMASPVIGTLPSNGMHPAWSPDGRHLAYIASPDAGTFDVNTGSVSIVSVDGSTIGPSTVLHAGSAATGLYPPGSADSYPTWSPDGTRIAFAHGMSSRSDGQAALYAMGPDGSGLVRLDRACEGPTGARNFQPVFSPFDGGGYQWITFLSRRAYGNNGAGHAQIWVAGIRTDAAAGEDPSEVAYWLPGQLASSSNISAFWARRACRVDGEACGSGSECCGGACEPGEDGAYVCVPPSACRMEGQSCTSEGDCCDDGTGLTCYSNVCVREPI